MQLLEGLRSKKKKNTTLSLASNKCLVFLLSVKVGELHLWDKLPPKSEPCLHGCVRERKAQSLTSRWLTSVLTCSSTNMLFQSICTRKAFFSFLFFSTAGVLFILILGHGDISYVSALWLLTKPFVHLLKVCIERS